MIELGSQHSRALLVGDNPFHNISHLSQERTRIRGNRQTDPKYAADLIQIAVKNGANGFLFSVSDTTLAILKELQERDAVAGLDLYPIVPYAYEYVRLAAQVGGMTGLAKVFSKRLVSSGSFGAVMSGLGGVLKANPTLLLRAYLTYELNRIKAAVGREAAVKSIILHEIIVDMALALKLSWVFEEHSNFALGRQLCPGFNTCNFAFLAEKLSEWKLDNSIIIAAPFNKVGFQMNPTKEDCEESLASMGDSVLLAISIFAAGYVKPTEAIDYVASLPNVRGVAVGVSKEKHAYETFKLLKDRLT